MSARPETSPPPPSFSACVVCGQAMALHLAGAPEVLRCPDCGLMTLAVTPQKDEREALYQEDYYEVLSSSRFLFPLEAAVRAFRRGRLKAILRREPGPASLLDVGCGRGIMLKLLKDMGWRVMGTQISLTAAEAARRRFNVDVVSAELPDIKVPSGSFRVISFFHVLEHVADPVAYIRKSRELLEDGGLLLIEVPNHDGFGFRLLGRRHFCFDQPNHLFFFTPRSLDRLLSGSGFKVIERSYFSLEYSIFSTLQNALNLIFPGQPNRLYRSFMVNDAGERLRRDPITFLHAAAAVMLLLPAVGVAAASLLLHNGNTMRFYARKTDSRRN